MNFRIFSQTLSDGALIALQREIRNEEKRRAEKRIAENKFEEPTSEEIEIVIEAQASKNYKQVNKTIRDYAMRNSCSRELARRVVMKVINE